MTMQAGRACPEFDFTPRNFNDAIGLLREGRLVLPSMLDQNVNQLGLRSFMLEAIDSLFLETFMRAFKK